MLKKILHRIKTVALEFEVMVLHVIGDNVAIDLPISKSAKIRTSAKGLFWTEETGL